MLAKLPLRSRLVLLASVPLFVLLGFAGVGISDRIASVDRVRQYPQVRPAFLAASDVARALENEAVASTWRVGAPGDADGVAEMRKTRAATDDALVRFEVTARSLASARPELSGSIRVLRHDLDAVDGVRALADQAGAPITTVGDRFLDLSSRAVDLGGEIARRLPDRDLSASLEGMTALAAERLAAAREATVVMRAATGAPASADVAQWIAAIAAQQTALARFDVAASPAEQAAQAQAQSGGPPSDPVRPAGGIDSLPAQLPAIHVTPAQYFESYRDKLTYLQNGFDAVQQSVSATASARESQERGQVLVYGFGAAALIALVLLLVWNVVRSVSRPLHALTDAARDLSEHRLPDLVDSLRTGGDLGPDHLARFAPIEVESQDEVGELARAFNTIQDVTASVAREQAELLRKGITDLYVNLARRNQSLIDRQIRLLDDLEGQSEDADQLAGLFMLDHLATRMRRNAENLLVMSGADQPRQWREAVSLMDVARAASGEIADFSRISFFGLDDDVAIAGNAVSDLVHLLAELFENATAFSPPGTVVDVAGMRAANRFVISVTDEGLGMDDERLAWANALMARPPAPGLSLSRTLGLLVVGHLAARHGIGVQLRRSASGGTTAVVSIPATVLARPAPGPEAAGAPDPVAAAASPRDRVVAEPVDVVGRDAEPSVWEPSSPSPWAGEAPVVVERVVAELVDLGAAHTVVEPIVVDPAVVDPAVVEPLALEPIVVDSTVVEPAVAEPDPVEPDPVFAAGPSPAPLHEIPTFDVPAFDVPAHAVASRVTSIGAVHWSAHHDTDPSASSRPDRAARPGPETSGNGEHRALPLRVPMPPAPPRSTAPSVDLPAPFAVPGRGTRGSGPAEPGPAEPGPVEVGAAPASVAPSPASEGAPELRRRRSHAESDADEPLARRVPGANLSHVPPGPAPGGGARPRPHEVHDLLTAHLRGIRDGREAQLDTAPGPDPMLDAAPWAAQEDGR